MVNLARFKQQLRNVPGLRSSYQLSKKIWYRAHAFKTQYHQALEQKNIKELFVKNAQRELQSFLLSQRKITFPQHDAYDVSVVIPVYNKAEFTFRCLRNLATEQNLKLEIIVINNASQDTTKDLLSRVENIKVIDNQENVHFLRASNQGAQQATATHVLFLNNDAEPQAGAISKAVDLISASEKIGAVGAKLILPNGQLQEAGCIMWSDGCCQGYGRGWNPETAEAQFQRVVDYCSGAFLLTTKDILEKTNYFDLRFSPAYYEETDFCLMLQHFGYQVIYSPEVVVNHFEFASAGISKAIELMNINRLKLVKKHGALLRTKHNRLTPPFLARSLDKRPRVLYIDELLPQVKMGAGYPRANSMVESINQLGYFVTVYPLLKSDYAESWSEIYQEFSRAVEILVKGDYGVTGIARLMSERVNFYDYVWISRPSTMTALRKISPDLGIFAGAKIIYDAEALFTLRDVAYGKITGKPLATEEINTKIKEEMALSKDVDAVSSVSSAEAKYFIKSGIAQVEVLSFVHQTQQNIPSFESRQGLLFMGAMHDDFGPNSDSVLWFVENVLPILKQQGFAEKLRIVGTNRSPKIQAIKDPQVEVIGAVADLTSWINSSRVFVAPTRFAAGIPHKITEVSSYGLPAVVSELLHEQLAWNNGSEYLVGTDPENFAEQIIKLYQDTSLWNQISSNVIKRINQDFSKNTFGQAIKKFLSPTL